MTSKHRRYRALAKAYLEKEPEPAGLTLWHKGSLLLIAGIFFLLGYLFAFYQ